MNTDPLTERLLGQTTHRSYKGDDMSLPPILQELRDAINAYWADSSPEVRYRALSADRRASVWLAASEAYPALTRNLATCQHSEVYDREMLTRLAEIEIILAQAARLRLPPAAAKMGSATNEVRTGVDAPPGARDMFACSNCKRLYPTITEATECCTG